MAHSLLKRLLSIFIKYLVVVIVFVGFLTWTAWEVFVDYGSIRYLAVSAITQVDPSELSKIIARSDIIQGNKILKIGVASSDKISAIAKLNKYWSYVAAYYCDSHQERMSEDDFFPTYFYAGDYVFQDIVEHSSLSEQIDEKGRFHYTIYMPVTNKKEADAHPGILKYDFRQPQGNLCLSINGLLMFHLPSKSPVIFISAETLRNSLKSTSRESQ